VPTMVTAAAAGAGAPVMTVPFNANIDPGMVQYDANGNLRTINWQSFMVGVQYYLPPKGRIFISANYTQANSDNITEGLVDAALGKVFTQSQYVEVNAFADITTAVRTGAAWQRVMQTYGDGARETNDRFMYALYYFF